MTPDLDVFIADHDIRDVTHDSREVRPGSLFVCIPGDSVDGHDFAADAVSAGAAALVCERSLGLEVPQCVVPDARAALADAAVAVWGDPSRSLVTVGVTGTAGKTTVTHLIGEALRHAGMSSVVFGTLSGERTTPEASDLQRRLATERDAGTESVVMEVSSHALDLHRVRGTSFDVAVFTNLGHDHLDFHHTMEDYFAAKSALFTTEFTNRAVVCVDDVWGQRLADDLSLGPLAVDRCSTGDARDPQLSAATSSFAWRAATSRLETRLIGRYNLTNLIIAATTLSTLGLSDDQVVEGLSRTTPVPGRLEVVSFEPGQPAVVVDYAHKPDALVAALTSVRELTKGSLIVVFGAGGDRDPSKRAPMGDAARAHADVTYATSDNPRTEDPLAIIADIVGPSADASANGWIVEPDRGTAIERAIAAAGPDDLVLIAGKGHETTQTIGTEQFEFDDRVVARQLLEQYE